MEDRKFRRYLRRKPEGITAAVWLSHRQAIRAGKFVNEESLAELLEALRIEILEKIIQRIPLRMKFIFAIYVLKMDVSLMD